MTPKISVIMPMHNVEEYVELAITTILAQTFEDFEFIILDDASTDRTLEIAQSFDDPRIKLIRLEENIGLEKGPGIVRNIGIDCAHGEYVYFMDSDDAIMPDGLAILLRYAEEYRADIAQASRYFFFDDSNAKKLDENTKLIISGRDNVEKVSSDLKVRLLNEYCQRKIRVGPWASLNRRKFLDDNKLRFMEVKMHGDGLFLIQKLCATSNIIKFNDPFYIIRRRQGSVSRPNRDGCVDFGIFARCVSSFLTLVDSLEEVVSKACLKEYGEIDHYLVDTVCVNITSIAIFREAQKVYGIDPMKCWEQAKEVVEQRYKGDTTLLRKMVVGFFMQKLAYRTAEEENEQLKMTLKTLKDTINQRVPY